MTTESRAASFFLPQSEIIELAELGKGNVNDTWRVTTAGGRNFVLQRLNRAVFPDLSVLQTNLDRVTRHLQQELQRRNTGFSTLRPVSAPDGRQHFTDGNNNCWRLLTYIPDSCSRNRLTSPAQAREIGIGLGLFHRLLADLPLAALADPLPGFHVTPSYLEEYEQAASGGHHSAADCHDFILQRCRDVFLLEEERGQQRLGVQVIHGDPKVANFLFSSDGSRVISLIDLDTVMPGLLLHDLGDCLRSCCNPLGEEAEPAEIVFDHRLFGAVLEGYCSQAIHLLTPRDRELIVDAVRLISFELGIRFVTDHLRSNRYFKVRHPQQNLLRARGQFALVRSIEEQYTELKATWARIITVASKKTA